MWSIKRCLGNRGGSRAICSFFCLKCFQMKIWFEISNALVCFYKYAVVVECCDLEINEEFIEKLGVRVVVVRSFAPEWWTNIIERLPEIVWNNNYLAAFMVVSFKTTIVLLKIVLLVASSVKLTRMKFQQFLVSKAFNNLLTYFWNGNDVFKLRHIVVLARLLFSAFLTVTLFGVTLLLEKKTLDFSLRFSRGRVLLRVLFSKTRDWLILES